MYLFLVRYYFYQWNHEKLKSLNSHMKVVSQGQCGSLPSPAAKIKVTYQKLFPMDFQEAIKRPVLKKRITQC